MRVAIYLTGEGTAFCLERYGSYADLFIDLLGEPGTCFDVYDNQKGRTADPITDYDALIITGSAADAHADLPWIHALNASIAKAREAGLKIGGFCFGHQAVANALGGRSARNEHGWELGVCAVETMPLLARKPYAPSTSGPIEIIEIHRDQVVELPPDAEWLASTPHTPIQMYAIGDRVLCMQGHPELFNPIVREFIETRIETGAIPDEVGEAALDSLSREPDRAVLQDMLKRWLYG